MELDIDAWMDRLRARLEGEFGERLVLLGLQGSRSRGEARADSDIDVVVAIDGLGFSDLQAYKDVIAGMPHAELACGFVGSPEVLAGWPRYDSFNLVMDTDVCCGSFDFMDADFTAEDAVDAAKAGASMIYHAVCHGELFDGDALSAIVADCVKSAFFVMRALAFARTGEYPASRKRMREIASDNEAVFLDAYDDPGAFGTELLAQKLLEWSSGVLR